MPFTFFRFMCFVTLLTHNLATCATVNDDDDPRRTFPFRRAIDGSRGRKFYDAENDGFLYSHGSSGRYDPDHHANDFSDIRNNVPGEPGVDYPSYTRLPQTGFVCQADFRGYYADEIAGCQVFHVCDGTFLVSSFLCPVGSVFSQKLLTCDWWTKVDCSTTRNYYATNVETHVSEVDDDEILRKAFEIPSVQSSGERIPAETLSTQLREPDQRRRVSNYEAVPSTGSISNDDPQTGSENYSDYADYPSRVQSRFRTRTGSKNRQRYREDYYYGENVDVDDGRSNVSPIKVHTVGNDRNNDRPSLNEFEPSYAPTVPTVITTTRRYYSPTFPTTHRPSTESKLRGRFDLEVESSDHLYTAKGRSVGTLRNAVTPPSVFAKVTTGSNNFDLARLVNSAGESNEQVEKMQQSESSDYKTNVAPPFVRTNDTETITFADLGVGRNRSEEDRKIIETFAILTIDDKNSNTDKFVYNREEETIPTNDTVIHFISTLDETNSTKKFIPETNKNGKIAAFLQPPRDDVKQFRITVLEAPSTPEIHFGTDKSDGSIENNSKSGVRSIQTVQVPDANIRPPFFDREDNARESRVIRIFAKNDNLRNEFLEFTDVDSASAKIVSNDSIPSNVGSDGEHPTTERFSENSPKEQILMIMTTGENKNLTSSTKKNSTDVASSKLLENSRLTDAVNASMDVEESPSNGRAEAPLKSSSSIDEQKKNHDHNKSEEISVTAKVSATTNETNNDRRPKSEETIIEKTLFTQEKSIGYTIASEDILLNAKTAVSNEKTSSDYEPGGKISSNEKITNVETKNDNNNERSSRSNETETVKKNIGDSLVEESSPYEVTLTVNKDEELDPNGDVIRELIANQHIGDSIIARGYKSFEIVKSDAPKNSKDDREDLITITDSRIGRKIDSQTDVSEGRLNNFPSNSLKSRNDYRSLISLVNGPNLSRPFALEPSRNVQFANPSFIVEARPSKTTPPVRENVRNHFVPIADRISSTTRQTTDDSSVQVLETSEKISASSEIELASNEEISDQLRQNFSEGEQRGNKENLIFDLPHERRSLDFKSGQPIETSEKINERIDDDSAVKELKTTPKTVENTFIRTVVETEFVPSISFSLNTDDEREEYMEAVMKGLLPDIRAAQSMNNETDTSVES